MSRADWSTPVIGVIAFLAALSVGFFAMARNRQHDSASLDEPVLAARVLRVIDGDSIDAQLSSGPVVVRFNGIDAPEHDQPGGAEAASALRRRLRDRDVSLQVVTQDRYERLVAVVYLGNEDVNQWLVRQGHAWAYRAYLRDPQYCVAEGEAREARRGLWGLRGGVPLAPWEWREAKRGQSDGYTDYRNETVDQCISAMRSRQRGRPTTVTKPMTALPLVSAPAQENGCRIKGNISDRGRIYHLPGSDSYDRTKIDTSRGERWFCSEAEARAAGWRRTGG